MMRARIVTKQAPMVATTICCAHGLAIGSEMLRNFSRTVGAELFHSSLREPNPKPPPPADVPCREGDRQQADLGRVPAARLRSSAPIHIFAGLDNANRCKKHEPWTSSEARVD